MTLRNLLPCGVLYLCLSGAAVTLSPGTAAIAEQTRRSYPGRVEMGEDLMVIDVGAEVRVRAHRQP